MKIFILLALSLALHGIAQADASPAQIEQGRYMTRLSGCANCHTQSGGGELAGGAGIVTPAGTIFPPNITADENYGIGKWTDAEFIKAIRKGISPSGHTYFPVFPYQSFTQMTDGDILAIRAYIGTLPKVAKANSANKIGGLANFAVDNGIWDLGDSMQKSHQSQCYHRTPGEAIGPGDCYERNFFAFQGPFEDFDSMKNDGAHWNRGAYLVEGPLHCTECHTPRDDQFHLKISQWMSGWTSKTMWTPDILTEDKSNDNPSGAPSMVSTWTAEDWDHFLTTGEGKAGESAFKEMAEVVSTQTSALTAEDRAAVIRYLMSLMPVKKSE